MNYTYAPNSNTDTICALATANGMGAIAVIRISGKEAIIICDKIFKPFEQNFTLRAAPTHTVHYGKIMSGDELIDNVLVSVFQVPKSYTGENVVEISCHGSVYIQKRILKLLVDSGARLAKPGEFTLRAFMNGKFDLSQAEAVADLIASHSKTSHDLALNQMRGGFSSKIADLRKQLIEFASLIELELDFSEEDVEFANRDQFIELVNDIKDEIHLLIKSFSVGNVIKKGIPVAIIGNPNVGKSTLLNAILNEEKAIVSDIPGTTRDVIEDTINIEGVAFRFIDTAGLRSDSDDEIENLGINRTYEMIQKARIIMYIFDVNDISCDELENTLNEFEEHLKEKFPDGHNKKFIIIGNKMDLMVEIPKGCRELFDMEAIFVSAKRNENIHLIIESLMSFVDVENISDSTIVSSSRHYEALTRSLDALQEIELAFNEGVPTDLIATDIRTVLHHLGEITGEVTTDELLGNIFGRFCIGK